MARLRRHFLPLWVLLFAHAPRVGSVVLLGSRALRSWKKPSSPQALGHNIGRGLFGGGDIVEGETELKKRGAKCFEDFPAPEKGSRVCPAECPFMQYTPSKICHYNCITEEHCVSAPNMPASVANVESGMCTLCRVAGCKQCVSNDADKCGLCKPGFDFEDGRCLPQSRWGWRVVYAVLGVIVLVFLIWLVRLAWKPVVNQAALDAALTHRSHSKIRHEMEFHRLYPLHTNLCKQLIPQGGVGVQLHFRFESAALHWTFFVAVVMGFVALMHGRLRALTVLKMAPNHEEIFESCRALEPEDQIELEAMRIDFLYATAFVYAVSFLGALMFAVSQRRTFVETDAHVSSMADFALFVKGFPRDPWGPTEPQEGQVGLEDEYTQFFRDSAWGDGVLGVSIAWDMADKGDDALQVLDDAIARMEADRRGEGAIQVQLQPPPSRCCPCLPDIEGKLLGVKEPPPAEEREAGEVAEAGAEGKSWRGPAALAAFTDLQTTGYLFVVFQTKDEMLRALETPLPKFRGTHDLTAKHLDCEPATVLWDGFGVKHRERYLRVVRGIFELLLLMVAWAVLFWGPYTYYVVSWTKVAGATTFMEGTAGTIQTTVLGLLITAGNQMVYAACAAIAEQCRFTTRDSRDQLSVVLYTFAVSLNTVLDLGLIIYMAHGYQQDSGLNEEALVRNPSMQHAIFVQLIGYIYPGTILIPYLVEPIATCIGPFYLFSWLVRSRPDVTPSQAEKCLECPPFDLNRYGDIVVNIVLCNLIFFLTSVNIWWLFAQLVTSMVVVYLWDHCRFLRESQRSEFATNEMDVCGQYLLVFPCAILAGGLAFKWQGGQAMVKGWDRNDFLDVRMEWIYVVAAMLAHTVAHLLLLRFVVPVFVGDGREQEHCTYEDVARECSTNWFNANPVNCLRSLHHHVHDPPHIYDYPGKGHLHEVNYDIHAYYQAPDFEAEASLISEVVSEVKEGTIGAIRSMRSGLSAVSSQGSGLPAALCSPRSGAPTPRSPPSPKEHLGADKSDGG